MDLKPTTQNGAAKGKRKQPAAGKLLKAELQAIRDTAAEREAVDVRRFREAIVTAIVAAGVESGDLVKAMHLGEPVEKLVTEVLYGMIGPDRLSAIEDGYRKRLKIRDLARLVPVLQD